MPIYEYICKECQNACERIVFNKRERISCPKCGSKRLATKLSVVNTGVTIGDNTASIVASAANRYKRHYGDGH